jgi:WhiB family redox-sensing transcriptional regulator
MPTKPYLTLNPVADAWEWQQQGNCVGKDPEMFFLEHNMRDSAKRKKEIEAKAVCKGCPVIAKCLNHALTVPETYGVWGGMSADERHYYNTKRRVNA